MINMFQKNMKIIFMFFIVVLSLYFIINIVNSVSSDDFELQQVENYTYSDYELLPGIALRNEEPIYADSDYKNINYEIANGARVAKNSVLAKYNTIQVSEDDITAIDKLDRKISMLSKSTENNVVYDVLTIDSNIKDNINLLLTQMESRNFHDVIEKSNDINLLFNKKDIKVSGADYYTAKLKEYQALKDSVLKKNAAKEKNVVSPAAGYFYSGYDGYEYLKDSDFSEITVEKLEELLAYEPKEIDGRYIGKLQDNSEWHYFSYVSEKTAKTLYTGQAVQLEFSFKHVGSKRISFYIDYISAVSDGKAAVDFRCETLNDDIFTLRKETAKLILTSYSGFKIDNSALHVDDQGVQGVYVLSAQRLVFRPVTILYSTEEFSIVSTADSLKAKDEIIIGGKDLYDGKIVKP